MKPLILLTGAYIMFTLGYCSRAVRPMSAADYAAENYRVLQRIDTWELLGTAIDCLAEEGNSPAEAWAIVADAMEGYPVETTEDAL